jgi:hypothetical protein
MTAMWQEVARRSRSVVAVWLLLVTCCAAVLLTPQFLPFYDYPEWLLQAQIVHDLWTGAASGGVPVARLYALLPVPVPNLAAPVGIALLAFVLPIELAGRAFLVLGVAAFGGGYAFLVRTVQGRATALELTGLVWAFGYFLQRGYVSYLFAFPLAFVGIGLVHRYVERPGRARLAALSALQALTFLAHLVAWAVLVVALGCYAVVLYRRDRRAAALRLTATAAPAAALLGWYAAASREVGHLAPYATVRDKALSLLEAVQFFLRLDPFPGVVPAFPAQLAVTVALAAVVGFGVRRRALRAALARPLAVAALILAALAVLDPIGNVNSLTKPDQRLLFPAIVLLAAALPWRPLRPRACVAAVGVVLATLALHGVAWVSMDGPLQQASDAIGAGVPAGAAVATVAVPSDGGCSAGVGPSVGIPALKWFDVHRLLRGGEVRAELQETSAVVLRFDPRTGPGLTTISAAPPDAVAAVPPAAYVEVFGCAADVALVVRGLAPRYAVTATGPGYAVLRG